MWDVIIIVATIYVALIVPYNAAFYGTSHDTDNVTVVVENHFYCPQGISIIFIFLKTFTYTKNIFFVLSCFELAVSTTKTLPLILPT